MVQLLNIHGQQPPDPPPQEAETSQVCVSMEDTEMFQVPRVDQKDEFNISQEETPVFDIDITSSTTSSLSTICTQPTDVFIPSNSFHSSADQTITTINMSESSPNDCNCDNISQHSPQHCLVSSNTSYSLVNETETFVSEPFVGNSNTFIHPPSNSQALTDDSCYPTSSTTVISSNILDNATLLQQADNFNQNMLYRDSQLTTENTALKNITWIIDNSQKHYNSDMSISDSSMTDQQQDTSDFIDCEKRVRRDSSDSEGAMSTATSGDTFTSAYLDTVSSVASSDFLFKLDESDEDIAETDIVEPVQKIYFNNGYVSYSSSEKLDLDKENDIEENIISCPDNVEQPLLGDCNCSNQQDSCKEDTESELMDNTDRLTVDDFVPHHLIPITENEVIAFTVEEVVPTTYTKITDNLTVVDESFLLESQTSLFEPESAKYGKRAATMQNLHEHLSFLDLTEVSKVGRACQKALIYLKDDMAFGSMASINTMANKDFEKDPTQGISLIGDGKDLKIVPSTRHTRNLVALSLCITLLYIAIGSVRNLQSSINHEGGVGVISMAAVFVGYMVGSVFSVSILQNFQPRNCIIFNLIPNLLYVAANIYPTLWLMLPISLVQGVSAAIIWNAMSTYVTFLARGRAQKKNENFEIVSGRFFGLLLLIFQSNMIVGNLISSLVLMYGGSSNASPLPATNISMAMPLALNKSENVTYGDAIAKPLDSSLNLSLSNATLETVNHLHLCGSKFCQHFDVGGSGFSVSDETKYVLFGTYMGCIILAMLIAIFFLEPLNLRLFGTGGSALERTKAQLISLAKFSVNPKFLLLLPLSMYSSIQYGFVTAEITKAFVTCPLGIHMVGYTMICMGVCGSISSYVSGLLTKIMGRISLILIAEMKEYKEDIMTWRLDDLDSHPTSTSVFLTDRLSAPAA